MVLDEQTTEATQETPIESGAAAPEAVPAVPEAPKPAEASNPAGAEAQPIVPAFTPNFKFKVMDKEHELDEMFRPLVKDQATEKKVKELFEKSMGFDFAKPKHEAAKVELAKLRDETTQFQSQLSEIRDDYNRNDFDGVFKKLGIPEEKILQWLVDKAKYNELPQEQRQILDSKRQAEERATQLEKQHSQVNQGYEGLQAQVKRMELERVLDRPEVKGFSDAFDAKAGTPGAFWNAVVEHGQMVSATRKIDLTADQAAKEVMSRYGMFYQPQAAQQGSPQAPVIPAAQNKPPVIPNISGRSQSPMDKKPNSIEDLKKLSAAMN